MHEFWYDYMKPKDRQKTKKSYMDTDSLIVYPKTENIYVNVAKYVETKIDTSNYELDRPLPNRKKLKSNWINEKWNRWKNNDRVCCI